MAMANSEANFVRNTQAASRVLINEAYGLISQLNVLWNGAPDYKTTITQADLDSVPSFLDAGLTKETLTDAEYALALILGNITTYLPQLTVLANLP